MPMNLDTLWHFPTFELNCCTFSSCRLQSIALFTPLVTILLFALLKRTERGEIKEASLGESNIHTDVNVLI